MQDAEDLLGEVMVVAWRRASQAPAETTALEMWLFGVARNTLGTFYRGQARRHRLHDRIIQTMPVHEAGQGDSDVARADALREALQTLSSRDRDLLTLVHWDGFALHQAATILGLRASTARSRYARLRQKLRMALTEPPSR